MVTMGPGDLSGVVLPGLGTVITSGADFDRLLFGALY